MQKNVKKDQNNYNQKLYATKGTRASKICIGLVFSALTIIPIAYAEHDKSKNGSSAELLAEVSKNASSAIPEKREFPLNEKVSPCDDFHAYVCSQAEASFKLREDRSYHVFSFDDSDERLLEKKKEFFKNIDKEKKMSARSAQMKQFYKACMNEASAKNEELGLVKKLKTEVAAIKSIKDYIKLNKKNMTNEKWSFVSYEKSPNIDNPKIYDILFDLNFMFLPEHSYYDNDELTAAYADLITEFFLEIYPNIKREELHKRAVAVVDFEKKFKQTYPMPAEFRQRYTQPRYVSREDFFKQTSAIGLADFFKQNVPQSTKLRDFIPESFVFAQAELKNENLQILKDMYVFRSARGFMDDAYPELYKKRLAFSYKYLGGSPVRPERQERCTTAVMGSFNRELDLELLPRIFPQFPEEKMQTVVDKIRQSIISGLQNNTWLSADGKKEALAKIEKAKLQIIKPKTDKEWDFKPIQTYSDKNPYENNHKLAVLGHKESFKDLRDGVNQEAWGWGPLIVNAYYSPDKNKFVLPIGILQYPFFVPEGDVIENLGAVGAVTAHELGHAIDDQGAKFDSDGKLRQWMSEADINNFQARGQKMVQQFAKVGHNGELTLGENVADLVGLTFAYRAAFPGGKGTIDDKKKFFTAYARLYCGIGREKTKEMLLKTDPHSLGFARINEQVKHQPGFYEAYSCSSKNKMYLSEKERIQIW